MAGNGHTSFYAMFRLGGSTHTLSAKFSKGVVPMAKNRLFPVPGIYGLHMTAPHGETIEMNWIWPVLRPNLVMTLHSECF